MSEAKESNNNGYVVFGVTIPKTIGIATFWSMMCFVVYSTWSLASINNNIQNSSNQVAQLSQDIQKIRNDMYTRSEAAMQNESYKREMDEMRKILDRHESDIKYLMKER